MKLITTHKGSDFDALASLVAANVIYPDALPVLPGTVNENLKPFLAIHKDLFKLVDPRDVNLDEVDSLVVVDTHVWNRLDQRLLPLREKAGLEVTIWDHHMEGDMEGEESHVRETGSTVTMIIQEIQNQKKLITPIQATLFLMGLYEDTGNLTFPSTLPEDAHAAGYLLDRKADLNILSAFLKQAYGHQQKEVLSRMIDRAEKEKVGDWTLSFSVLEIEGRIQNLAMVVQMYREIVNADVAFGIFRDVEKDRCMVIGRSGVDDINLAVIMRALGGGGHPGAGSALLKKANPDVIKEMIQDLILGNQHTSIMLSDIMSYPVITVNHKTPVEKVGQLLRDMGCTGMPVVDDEDRPVGVISRRDFRKVKKEKEQKSPIKAFMSRKFIHISPDKSAVEAARLMIKHDIGRIPVVEDEKIIGIITRSDVMMFIYDLLPD